MKRLGIRASYAALVALAALLVLGRPSFGGIAQQQRAQQTVYILVNVTNPLGRVNAPADTEAPGKISARIALRAKGSQPSVDASATNISTLVAQNQGAVRVQAEVTPNPNATLLVTSQTNVTMNATAGTPVTASCVFTVTSNAATISSWTIRQGVANDFISGTWPGNDLADNVYISTPQPTATPLYVYPSAWAPVVSSANTKTYCVDLTLTVPSSVKTGSYSTTAVYTLYW